MAAAHARRGDVAGAHFPEAPKSVRRCDKVISHKYRFVGILTPKVARSTLLRVMTRTHAERFGGAELKMGLRGILKGNEYDDYVKWRFGFEREVGVTGLP